MIGYVTLGTNDPPRAKAFYDTLLAEMGVKRMMEFGNRGYAWAAAMDKPMLCIMKPYDGRPATVGNGVMVGIAASSRDQVDRIYKKALELGGADEGTPGLRDEGRCWLLRRLLPRPGWQQARRVLLRLSHWDDGLSNTTS